MYLQLFGGLLTNMTEDVATVTASLEFLGTLTLLLLGITWSLDFCFWLFLILVLTSCSWENCPCTMGAEATVWRLEIRWSVEKRARSFLLLSLALAGLTELLLVLVVQLLALLRCSLPEPASERALELVPDSSRQAGNNTNTAPSWFAALGWVLLFLGSE